MKEEVPVVEEVKGPKRRPPPPKKAVVNAPSQATPQATPPALSIKQQAQPPPTPVVAQLMEMGFERPFIEYAVKMTSNPSPERLITWMVDHQGMEVPEPEPLPPTPPLPRATEAPPTSTGKDHRSVSSCSYTSDGMIYSDESSTDSSDFSSGELVVEDEPDGEIPSSSLHPLCPLSHL